MSENPSSLPRRFGQSWTRQDHEELVALVRGGGDYEQLCEATGRSVGGVLGQLRRLLPPAVSEALDPPQVLQTARASFADPDYPWRQALAEWRDRSSTPRPVRDGAAVRSARAVDAPLGDGDPVVPVALPSWLLQDLDWTVSEYRTTRAAWIARALHDSLAAVDVSLCDEPIAVSCDQEDRPHYFLQVIATKRSSGATARLSVPIPAPIDEDPSWWERALRAGHDAAREAFAAVRVEFPELDAETKHRTREDTGADIPTERGSETLRS